MRTFEGHPLEGYLPLDNAYREKSNEPCLVGGVNTMGFKTDSVYEASVRFVKPLDATLRTLVKFMFECSIVGRYCIQKVTS